MRTEQKHRLAQLRHGRIRKKVRGTKERPRMSVCFTNKNIHVQFIDDVAGATLVAASTTGKAVPDRDKLAANAVSEKPSEQWLPRPPLARASKLWFLIVAARVITAKSKRWPMLRAKRACNFNEQR